MHATHPPSVVCRRDVRTAVDCLGREAGLWLSTIERHQAAMTAAEHARLLKEAGVSAARTSVVGRMRRAVGTACVGIGRRLQGTTLMAEEPSPL